MSNGMRAWEVSQPAPIDSGPLRLVELPTPEPDARQIRIRVAACGVCRTDLHIAEGDLDPHRDRTVPGHEVVGVVDELGPRATRFELGQRVGAAWLARTCQQCRFCLSGRENLCVAPLFTGWDIDGGYAEYMVCWEDYAYPLPGVLGDVEAAPLLCAGIIGYRALKLAMLPPGGRLGLYGFGGSAHLTAQVARAGGASIYVMTRSAVDQQLARDLGAAFVGGTFDPPPVPLDSAIIFAPVGTVVPPALVALDRGGTVAVAGIHLTDVPTLDYQEHLFQEKVLRSVTANTRQDGSEFLAVAARAGVTATVRPYPFEAADQALADLAHDRFSGAAVLTMAPLTVAGRPGLASLGLTSS